MNPAKAQHLKRRSHPLAMSLSIPLLALLPGRATAISMKDVKKAGKVVTEVVTDGIDHAKEAAERLRREAAELEERTRREAEEAANRAREVEEAGRRAAQAAADEARRAEAAAEKVTQATAQLVQEGANTTGATLTHSAGQSANEQWIKQQPWATEYDKSLDERNSYKRALDEHNKVKARQDQLNFELYCNRKISDFLSESAERIESVQRTLQDSRRDGPNSPGFLPSLQNIEQQLRGHMNACDFETKCDRSDGCGLRKHCTRDNPELRDELVKACQTLEPLARTIREAVASLDMRLEKKP